MIGTMGFKFDREDIEKMLKWGKEHECSITDVGACGGKYTYQFTPTTLGTVQKVVCACGEECDLTDYNW